MRIDDDVSAAFVSELREIALQDKTAGLLGSVARGVVGAAAKTGRGMVAGARQTVPALLLTILARELGNAATASGRPAIGKPLTLATDLLNEKKLMGRVLDVMKK